MRYSNTTKPIPVILKWMTGIGFLLLAINMPCFAQGENNQWRFWHKLGLNFNTNPPSFMGGDAADSLALASVADSDGNLLFSVGLNQVYDRNNNPMPNGGGIVGAITNSNIIQDYKVVIIPNPGNSNQYYIVALSSYGSNNPAASGVVYSLVDMNLLNNGLGDVVQGQKGVHLTFDVERYVLEVSSGDNCESYWIIIHARTGKNYFAYHLTASGINANPVVSAGLLSTNNYSGNNVAYNNAAGRIAKIKNNIIDATGSDRRMIETAIFNKTTGQFSDFKIIFTSALNANSAVRFLFPIFSPDGSKLYCAKDSFYTDANNHTEQYLSSGLIQFNMELLPDTLAVQNSEYLIALNAMNMRVGPDNKIYVSHFLHNSYYQNLAIIHNPNNYGATCNFDSIGILIPNSLISNFQNPNDVYFEEFGSNVIINLPTDTIFNNIYIDTNICPSQAFVLYADSSYKSPLWNANWFPVKYSDTIQESGINWVLGIKNCTYYMDSFHVQFHLDTNQNAPQHIKLCKDSSVLLQTTASFDHYYWDNGSNDSVIRVYQAGSYTLTGIEGCTANVYPFNVDHSSLQMNLGNDTSICIGDSLVFSFPADTAVVYQWQDGSASNSYTIYQEGSYKIKGIHDGCSFYDSIIVSVIVPQLSILTSDTLICKDDIISLSANATPPSTYVWQPYGQQTASIQINNEGNYIVSATNICGTVNDSVSVKVKTCPCIVIVPNAFSPNADGINDLFKPGERCPKISKYQLNIFNRFGQKVFQSNDINLGWDGFLNGKPCDVGTYFYYLKYSNREKVEITKKGDILLVR